MLDFLFRLSWPQCIKVGLLIAVKDSSIQSSSLIWINFDAQDDLVEATQIETPKFLVYFTFIPNPHPYRRHIVTESGLLQVSVDPSTFFLDADGDQVHADLQALLFARLPVVFHVWKQIEVVTFRIVAKSVELAKF